MFYLVRKARDPSQFLSLTMVRAHSSAFLISPEILTLIRAIGRPRRALRAVRLKRATVILRLSFRLVCYPIDFA